MRWRIPQVALGGRAGQVGRLGYLGHFEALNYSCRLVAAVGRIATGGDFAREVGLFGGATLEGF